MLYKHARERLPVFVAPRAHLSKEKEEEIVKNLKKYSKRFDELDGASAGSRFPPRRRSRCSTRGTDGSRPGGAGAEYQAKVAEPIRRYPVEARGGPDVVEEQVEVEEIISVQRPHAA